MPKGLCDVLFIGGTLDGETIQFPSMQLSDTFIRDTETFFVEETNGSVSIYKGVRKASIPWTSFGREIYTKNDKAKDEDITFSFTEVRDIERCQATTKAGNRCGHEAIYGKAFCNTHKDKNE